MIRLIKLVLKAVLILIAARWCRKTHLVFACHEVLGNLKISGIVYGMYVFILSFILGYEQLLVLDESLTVPLAVS